MNKPFDMLESFGRFGFEQKLSLRDPATASAFLNHVDDGVARALNDPALLQGQRAEAMFEALLISLGEYKLLTPEDGGRVFPADSFIAPDFRVVLLDDTQWLVEVKNVYEADPLQQRRRLMTRDYHQKLAAYSAATGAALKLAVFWARWSIWTLVSPERLVDADGVLDLDMQSAMQVNEMSRLGDRTIGTRAPLTLRLNTDPDRTGPIMEDGTVQVTLGGAQFFCDGVEVTDPIETEIVWVFAEHGEWREHGPRYIVNGDRLEGIEFRWAPEEPSNQGFDMVGTLSRIFARYYAECTVEADTVVHLRAPLRPGWLAPLVARDDKDIARGAVPLWRFEIQPNYEGLASRTDPARTQHSPQANDRIL